MSAYMAGSKLNLQSNSPVVNGNPITSSRGPKSETGLSTYSQKSTGSTKKYPRKGSTLGNIELSPEEMEHLESVLQRFDQFRITEENRVRTLRDQLVEKQKVRIQNAEASGDGHCYNCGRLFMALFNPPCQCYICKHQFCRLCLEKMPKSKETICKFCRFESVHRGRLGVWFTEELKLARAQGRVRGVSGPEALRSSLLRIKRESRANSIIQNAPKLGSHSSMESLPLGSDVGYSQPRTETWVQQAQSEHDQRSVISTRTPRDPTPERGKPTAPMTGSDVSYVRTPSVTSDRLTGSVASINRPATPTQSRQGFHSSFSDLRSHVHQARLTSEAGSKSTLSLASKGTGSMLSLYSERESSYTHGIQITGDLRLDIRYDHQSTTLRIGVKQARDLAIADKKHQACNPYVKCYLLPDKTKGSKRKTSYKKHTRNPVFEEELKYTIPFGELTERSLQIAVWHKASVGTNLFLGEVIIPFSDFSFEAGANWFPLGERRQVALSPNLQIFRGELLMALKLVPGGTMGKQSELHVWIKSAKGLSTSTSGRSKSSTVDPYCKIYLLPGKPKNSKRKTNVLKKNNNPEWNTNFVYQNIDRTQLNSMGLEISIYDHDRLSANDFLGGCRINNGNLSQPWMDATGTEQTVWLAMMERPQTWFEGLIRLRSNLD